MKQQTAVEWLINQHFGGFENCTPDFRNHIEQAKAMEKEQIEKGVDKANENWVNRVIRPLMTGEDYYNETYNK